MARPGRRLPHLLLRYAPLFSRLRRIPIFGDFLSWVSRQLVPAGTLLSVQIEGGPAQGLWIYVNPRTGFNFQQGIGEPKVQWAMQQYLCPGMAFYDLGANIGFFSLLAARLVGPSGRVFSFEADPEIAARLRENLNRNGFTHALVVEEAVWSKSGNVPFARAESNVSPDRGLGHVLSGDAPPVRTINVRATSLDDFVLSHAAPQFVKCDVEGAEVAVFQGAERMLREVRPILLVEMHSTENHLALTQKFAEFGYSCSKLDENHLLALPQ